MGTGESSAQPDDGTVTWGEVLAETTRRLAGAGLAAQEARWIVAEASGLGAGTDRPGDSEAFVTVGGMSRVDTMVERRLAGEPLQYVLGSWSFRTLDLMVDRRVLIPRPETEAVVGYALDEFDRLADRSPEVRVADLGTGSGAIGLSIAAERVSAKVWCSDVSTDALAVTRANLAGLGRPAMRVTVVEGSWFDALPPELAGGLGVVVSNPPYVATGEALPSEVADWEPGSALTAGPLGTEYLEQIISAAPVWLMDGGALILELSPEQAVPMADHASSVGFVDVEVRPDLTGCPRALVARRP
ncbi:MAG TPA: peptide chain release factor N(5)-glutamine methyltransferase [Acidimicrobiales bacterium]|nr:peptide chain release factor N(5)-glutamine methyltransferase [Acidimicrobiales bacterium]MDP6213626.1 peptide chain release factor N(5)-glutamine methyltransferase [Acidimicrobiales bacterium]MDP7209476.1 peptide chain release factor N(5)-glutamine methyltransferase [Acidimicrobiales bacterium]HJL90422.1 peptide chain release factor N(5)-glutamine methyltransferase [Acidimicrobiales bacterium]HJO99907.1 peptide chain release factor N(5)-glutamine methyltransferase [Acidimicrobiales bacteriu